MLQVGTEEERRHERARHHLRVAHPALRIVPVPQRLEQIVAEAVDRQDLVVYEACSCSG
jgi:hypothetical protein